jgi:LysR family transcriptional activator of glutamate synthase operon
MQAPLVDGIEALAALADHGTVTEAARALGLSQSAVSKRLQALERAVGVAVLAPDGRKLTITTEGQDLLDRARPLLAGLRDLTAPRRGGAARWSVVLDDGLAASFGPDALAEAARAHKRLQLAVSTAPAGLVAERVRAGACHLGIGVGIETGPELVAEPLLAEPWALVHAGLDRRPSDGPLLLPDGAPRAALAAAEPELAAREPLPAASATAALRLAAAGFGDALVPLGHVVEADLSRKAFRVLAATRPVVLVARRSLGGFALFADLRDALRERAERRVFGKRRDKDKRADD